MNLLLPFHLHKAGADFWQPKFIFFEKIFFYQNLIRLTEKKVQFLNLILMEKN
jgi:hypothetical protein